MTARRTSWIDCVAAVALGVFLAGASSAPAAAEISEDVRKDIDALVEDLSFLVGVNLLDFDKLAIAESGTGFRVTLDGVRLLPDFERQPAIDTLILVLEPLDDGYRIAGVELPSILPLRSADGEQVGEMQFATLAFTGSWQRSISALIETNLALSGVTVASSIDDARFTMEAMRLDGTLTPDSNGKWREEVDAEITKLDNRQTGTSDSVAGLELHAVNDGIDLARDDQLQQLLSEASAQAASGTVDPPLLTSLYALGNTVAASHFKATARDLLLDQGNGQPLAVPASELSLSAEGLDGERSRMILHLKFDGADLPMSAAVEPGLEDAVGPQSVDLNVAIEELPWPAAWKTLIDAGYGTSSDGGELPMLGMALQEAGTRVRLLPSALSSAALKVAGSGEAQGDMAAAFGLVASFVFEIEGLPSAQSAAAAKPDGAGAADALGQLEGMGQSAADAGGAAVHRYDIVLGADGSLTVNGAPFPLFEGMQQQ